MYIEVINLRINELLEVNLSYQTVHSNLMNRMYEYKPYINLCCNYSITELVGFSDMRNFNKVYFSISEVYIVDKQYKKEVLELYLKNYIDINKILTLNEAKIEKLKQQKLDYTKYYNILKLFNNKLTDALIYEAYIFNPGDAFGKLFISKEESEILRVNIGASMKEKKRLLEEGKKVYNKEEEKEYLDKGLEYDGIKYFKYYPKIDFIVKWVRPMNLRKWFPFVKEYIYKPANSKKYSYITRMRDFIKEDRSRALIIYDRMN